MKRALLCLSLAGCQLIVGDIELKEQVLVPDVEPDVAALDAGDATVADAAPDVALDWTVELDLDVDADEGADEDADFPDVPVPDAPPPDGPLPDGPLPDVGPVRPLTDLALLAGAWHVYIARQADAPAIHQAVLRVDDMGNAQLENFEGTVLEPETVFSADEDRPGGVRTNLFPVVGPMVGAMDAQTGVGVLVNDPNVLPRETVAFLVRVGAMRTALPTASVYAHASIRPFGTGEIGLLSNPNGDNFRLIDRRLVGGESAENVALTRQDHPRLRHRLAYGDETGAVYTTAANRAGAAGYLDDAEGIATGLTISWAAGSGQNAEPVGGSYFCGGFTASDDAIWTRGDTAEIDRAGRIQWGAGGTATMTWQPGVLHFDSRNNFFGYTGGIALVEPSERVYVMIPATLPEGDGLAEINWGFAVCVTLDPPLQ